MGISAAVVSSTGLASPSPDKLLASSPATRVLPYQPLPHVMHHLQCASGCKQTLPTRTSQGYLLSVPLRTLCLPTWSCTWLCGTTLGKAAHAVYMASHGLREGA